MAPFSFIRSRRVLEQLLVSRGGFFGLLQFYSSFRKLKVTKSKLMKPMFVSLKDIRSCGLPEFPDGTQARVGVCGEAHGQVDPARAPCPVS